MKGGIVEERDVLLKRLRKELSREHRKMIAEVIKTAPVLDSDMGYDESGGTIWGDNVDDTLRALANSFWGR